MRLSKLFLAIPVALLMSCGGGTEEGKEVGEPSGNKKAEVKAENSITICAKVGKDEEILKTITGAATADYLIGLETLVHVKVTLMEGVEIANDQILECLKETTFTDEGFSAMSSEKCMEEAAGVKLMPSSGKNKRTIKGKEIYTYNISFKKSN